MSAMNVASYDVAENSRVRTPFGRLGESRILTGGALTRMYTSNAVGGCLYFINSDGSSSTRNAVMYIYASTYVLIHSPRRFANRF